MRSLLHEVVSTIEPGEDEVERTKKLFRYENGEGLSLKEIRAACEFYKKKHGIDSMIGGEIISPQNTSLKSIRESVLKEIQLICSKLKSNEQMTFFYKNNGLCDVNSHVQVLILRKDEVIIPIGDQQVNPTVLDFTSEDFQKIGLRCFASPISKGFFSTSQGRKHPQADDSSCATLGLFTLKKEMRSKECLKFEYYDDNGNKQGLFIGSLQTLHYSQSATYIDALENFLIGSEKSPHLTLVSILIKSIKKATEKGDDAVKENNQTILNALGTNKAHWQRLFESERKKRGLDHGRYNRTLLIRQLILRKKLLENDPRIAPGREWAQTEVSSEVKNYITCVNSSDCSNMSWKYYMLLFKTIEYNPNECCSLLKEIKVPEELDLNRKNFLVQHMLFYFPCNIMKREVLEKFFIKFLNQEDISKLLVAASCYYRWDLVEYLIDLKEPQAPAADALIYALEHAAHIGNQDAFGRIANVLDDRLDAEKKIKLQTLLSSVVERSSFNLAEEIKNLVSQDRQTRINDLIQLFRAYADEKKPTNKSFTLFGAQNKTKYDGACSLIELMQEASVHLTNKDLIESLIKKIENELNTPNNPMFKAASFRESKLKSFFLEAKTILEEIQKSIVETNEQRPTL